VTRTTHSGKIRARQALLTSVLAAPVVMAIAMAPPFAAEPRAQGSGMLGPATPILAGPPIVPTISGNTITVPSQWACEPGPTNLITLSSPDGSGRYRVATRQNGLLTQTMTITGFNGGFPNTFQLVETSGSSTTASGSLALIDANSDGIFESASVSGSISAMISFVFTPNGDYISIPWSQASALHIDIATTCAGHVPQVLIPLADTNNDGRGDSVVFDLDGNGVADANLFAGPIMVVPSVPTMGYVARVTLLLIVGLTGVWFLSRRRDATMGTPA
jgi:hypothetical protein